MAAPEKSRRSFLKHALLLSGATTLPTIWSKAEPPSGTLPAPAQGGEGAGIYGLTTLKQDDITNTGLVNNYGYNQELCKHYTCLRATGAVPIDGEILSVVEVPDQVPGKDQVYEVAPETGAI